MDLDRVGSGKQKNEDTWYETLGHCDAKFFNALFPRYSVLGKGNVRAALSRVMAQTIFIRNLTSATSRRATRVGFRAQGELELGEQLLATRTTPLFARNSPHFSPAFSGRSFVWSVVRSSRRAYGRFHRTARRARRTFWCRVILFPKAP